MPEMSSTSGSRPAIGARTAATIFRCLPRWRRGIRNCRSVSRNHSRTAQTAGCITSRLASMSCGRQRARRPRRRMHLAGMSLDGPSSTQPIVVEPVELLPTRSLTAQPPVRQVSSRSTSVLPLFHPGGADSDEPLIKVPSAPRPPLAVRRTPEKPRLRTVPKPVRRTSFDQEHDPVLVFAEEPGHVLMPRTESPAAESRPTSQRAAAPAALENSGPVRAHHGAPSLTTSSCCR